MTEGQLKCTFLIGAGRSGSTAFHHLLTRHPNVAWLSDLISRSPRNTRRSRWLMHALDLPGVGPLAARAFDPGECYEFWDHYYPGFSVPFRDLVADDVVESARQRLRQALGGIHTARRDHLVIKITGWPRVGFLREIFPEAQFVHVVRDGRAVASSLLNVPWWWGWRGPENWRWGPLPPDLQALWEDSRYSFVALAGLQWRILMDATIRSSSGLNADRFLQLRYEDLCDSPVEWTQRVTDFAGLPRSASFERLVARSRFRSENEKWRRDFRPDQQALLESVLRDHLVRFGYLA